MLKRKRDKTAVEEFCQRIRSRFGKAIKGIRLFGSKVIDKDTSESDIDLFIVVARKSSEVENFIFDTAFDIDLKYDVYLSPRIVSESILRHPIWGNTPFIRNVKRNGISL